MDLKYIIIIACSASVVVIVICGGCFLYCRTKKDNKQEEFIPTPKPPYNDYHQTSNKSLDKPIYDFPQPPPNFASDSEDDGMSTFNSAKLNYRPERAYLMNNVKSNSCDLPANSSEHIYFDIPEDENKSMTPSTEL